MAGMINIYLLGKEYTVPDDLTIMSAMEYVGHTLVHNCGCRNGFCGSCATFYRIKGENKINACLSCQTIVKENMCIAELPSFPLTKRTYDINELSAAESIMKQIYPEIYSCIGCGLCSKICPQGIDVMQYISYAKSGDFQKCAEVSFDCIMCGICSSRCPMGLPQSDAAMLARRINGKYLSPKNKLLDDRISEIKNDDYIDFFSTVTEKTNDELRNLYNNREIEK